MFIRSGIRRFLMVDRFQYLESQRKFQTGKNLFVRRNYYEILGVSKNASEKDIKKAYIQLAKKYHPDANPGNEEASKKFTDIAEAYSVLSNKQQRAAFDAESVGGPGSPFGSSDFDPLRRSTRAYGSTYEGFHSTVNPEELFRKIFGTDFHSGFVKNASRVWVDYAATDSHGKMEETFIHLTFREAAKGCEKIISANTVTVCEKCAGLGAEPGRALQLCPFCEGIGYEFVDGLHGKMQTSCRFCLGKGHNVVHKCSFCLGFGKTLVKRDVIVPVPPGIVDGETIKLNISPLEDDQVFGTNDIHHLYVTFKVSPSDYFRVDEDNPFDIHSDATISLSQAIFGGKIKIDGLYQDENIGIEPGTDSHTVICLNGKGLKKSHQNGYGDHYVHLKIRIPKNLSKEQQQILKLYAKTEYDTVGEINGIVIEKHKKTDKKLDETDEDKEYSAIDPEIGNDERKQIKKTASKYIALRMIQDLITEPARSFFQKFRLFYSELFKR